MERQELLLSIINVTSTILGGVMTCRAFSRFSLLLVLVIFVFQIGTCFTKAQDSAQSTDKLGARDISPPRREPIRVGGNVQARKLVNHIAPVYPDEAKKAHISGTVVLQVTVNEQGQVWYVVPI